MGQSLVTKNANRWIAIADLELKITDGVIREIVVGPRQIELGNCAAWGQPSIVTLAKGNLVTANEAPRRLGRGEGRVQHANNTASA